MSFQGHFENGVIIPDEPVNVPDGAKVRVELMRPIEAQQRAETAETTQSVHYQSIIGAIDDLPEDFAAQHDHYIHGTPKK